MFIQEAGAEESALARARGWCSIESEANVGIGAAYAKLLDSVTSEYFLFLECDWVLEEPAHEQITASLELLESGGADLVRLRSTRRPGFPLGVLRFQNREHLHPEWLLESCFYEPTPWTVFPTAISEIRVRGTSFAVSTSTHAAWTNNPHLASADFLRNFVDPTAAPVGNLETTLAQRWAELRPTVAQAPGLFSHRRLDGPAINRRGVRYHLDQRFRWSTRSIRRHLRRL